MNREAFEAVVRDALDDLPKQFAERLHNVAVVIEDEPAPELLRSLGLSPRRDTLFGLYQGVPMNERGASDGGALPDKISIYYRPLVRAFRTPARIRREIVKTLVHEIGHFFGLDDETIHDLGY